MNLYRPRKPVGTSQFMLFCIAVWEMLWNGKFPFRNTDTVKVERGPGGYAFHAAQPAAAGGKSGGGSMNNFVGEYDPGRTYSAEQIVIISMGANAGTYVYINATPSSGHAPYAGGGFWMQLPMGPSGMWL